MNETPATTKFDVITPGDPQYESWNNRGANLRYIGKPSRIILVASIEELTEALQETVNDGHHLAIRGGGHCLENFVCDPAVKVVIDISKMKGVRFDDDMNAIEVMAGTTLGEMHEKLYNEWGVVLPAGEHPAIGIGGHIQGGAFGFLCRQHGLGVDYLYAVEMLWVNKNRQVERIIATRDDGDVNRELWWAHTGGGAGNFGVVTRYWFSALQSGSGDPAQMLPKAPTVIETVEVDWDWNNISEQGFHQLVANFGNWSERNAGPAVATRKLFATLHLWNKAVGKIQIKGVLTEAAQTDEILQDFMEALRQDFDIPFHLTRKKLSWLDFALHPFPDIFTDQKGAFKLKDAFLHKPYTPEQIKVAYRYLTEWKDVPGGFIGLATYGGKVNAIAPDATASAQRSAILTTSCTAGWQNPADEEKHINWARKCYADLYSDTGGVPVPGVRAGGCIIAHPDNDMADPEWNKSGVPWHTFYYLDNYPRLQKVKAKWDPCNIFHHALSVQAG